MLTYSQSSRTALPKPTEKPWVLLLLCLIWLWLGILGHDPWKPDEPYVIAVVENILQTGNWLLPSIQGTAFLDKPPLYYWLGAALVKLLPFLAAHDAARLATLICMSLALLFMGMAGRDLIGRRYGRSVVMVLIGCIGLVETGHQLTAQVAGLVGVAGVFYALTLSLRIQGLAGALLGGASVVIFLSVGTRELITVWMTLLLLPAFSAWRTRRYLVTVLLGLVLSIPLILIWPLTLARYHSDMFAKWWDMQALSVFFGFGAQAWFSNFGYYLTNLVWFGLPAWPLAVWTLYKNRQHLDQPKIQLPLLFFIVFFIMLSFSKSVSMNHMVSILFPLAMLAAIELDRMRRGWAAFLNWFGLMAFGFFSILVWLGWLAMNFGWPEGLQGRAKYFSPYYEPNVSLIAAICAVIASGIWIWAVTRKQMGGRKAITNWAAGVTLFWGLAMTLWLPWFDAAKSYRPVVQQMMKALPANAQCVATLDHNWLARVSWQYYGHLQLVPYQVAQPIPCDYRLDVINQFPVVAESGWELIWYGYRPREQNHTFVLLRRDAR